MNARQLLSRILSPFALVLMMAFSGPAITAPAADNPSQADPPVDCKKTPDHPRCKDKNK
jgi:hypothetical protein